MWNCIFYAKECITKGEIDRLFDREIWEGDPKNLEKPSTLVSANPFDRLPGLLRLGWEYVLGHMSSLFNIGFVSFHLCLHFV